MTDSPGKMQGQPGQDNAAFNGQQQLPGPGTPGGPPGYGQQQPAYGQQQPQYGQPQPQQGYGQQAYAGGPTNVTIIQTQQAKPTSYLGFSIFVMICCNIVLGLIALIFSILSNSAADNGDMEGAKSKGKVAMWLNVAGIIITILIVIIVPVIYFTVILPAQIHAAMTTFG